MECTGRQKEQALMGRIIKALFLLALLGFIALVGYAYLGDLRPNQSETTKPVVFDAR